VGQGQSAVAKVFPVGENLFLQLDLVFFTDKKRVDFPGADNIQFSFYGQGLPPEQVCPPWFAEQPAYEKLVRVNVYGHLPYSGCKSPGLAGDHGLPEGFLHYPGFNADNVEHNPVFCIQIFLP